jgi:hypothetical protein
MQGSPVRQSQKTQAISNGNPAEVVATDEPLFRRELEGAGNVGQHGVGVMGTIDVDHIEGKALLGKERQGGR